MEVSTYLEAFLTVYGWKMYNTFYELLAMTWLLFFPFVRLAYDTVVEMLIDSERSYGLYKRGVIQFLIMVFILLAAVLPVDRISVRNTTLSSVCESGRKITEVGDRANGYTYRFDLDDEGKVPLFASLAMRIGHGINNVIYHHIPCVIDARLQQTAMSTVALEGSPVQDEVERFSRECMIPAQRRLMLASHNNQQIIDKLVEHYVQESGKSREFVMNYAGSPLLQAVMAGGAGMNETMLNVKRWYWKNTDVTAEMKEVLPILTGSANAEAAVLYSQGPVSGAETDYPENSAAQKTTAVGPVSCSKWWNGDTGDGLYQRVVESVRVPWIAKASMDGYVAKKCRPYTAAFASSMAGGSAAVSMAAGSCAKSIRKDLHYGSDKEMNDELVFVATKNATAGLLNNHEKRVTNWGLAGAAAGAFISFFSRAVGDALSSITSSATQFYGQMFIYRLMMKLLQPMLLMGIYAFWGIYLLVGNYDGKTVLRGLVLMMVIILFPGMWAMADHLDASLFSALVQDPESLTPSAGMENNLVERLLLDMANTAFYVIFPLLLLYLVSEAGSSNAGRAVQASNEHSRNIGGTGGGALGQTAQGGIQGMQGLAGKAKGKFFPGGGKKGG